MGLDGGMLSPFLFNLYTNDLSGNTTVNHLLYADDIVLLAPLAKGLQRFLDVSYNYGCGNDILFN